MIVSLRETTSTNDYAKKLAGCGVEQFTTVTAHNQTAGKGRLGRSFDSPEDEGIYMSIILYPQMKPELISMVTVVAAMAVKKVLDRVFKEVLDEDKLPNLQIKWPNDIVAHGKKLCGILTEASMAEGEVKHIVVGIGINVDNESFSKELEDKAVSLRMLCGESLDKKAIINMVVDKFKKYYSSFEKNENLKFMLDEYNQALVHNEKEVQIINGKENYCGVCHGMDETGALLVTKDGDDKVTKVISGEISVRGVYGYV